MPGSTGGTDAAGYRPLLFSVAYGMTGSVGDGGGEVRVFGTPLAGRPRVVRLLLGVFRRAGNLGVSHRMARVNGRPGAVRYDAEGRVVSVVELGIAEGVVHTIRSVADPDKLGHLGPLSDVARRPEE
ncbi:hypothetical protein [Streptomyces sp. NPDC006274]|uniref:hypothetical protein n=1 Tax=unclassified Streptomyces TaxID=2593676 RepID=UPI0033AAB81E